jgi:mannose-6-phosphate isomerase
MGKGDPKTECWYIISAEPGAVLYKGLKSGVTREAFAEAIRQGTVAELLGKVPVAAGECHFLPAGTAHSIGAGLLIAEIQTPSDTTYRVFDWNRLDDSGKPRQLHIEEALESINFEAAGEELPATTIGRLVDCEYFKIDKGHQAAGCELPLSAGTMKMLIMMTGRGQILGGEPGSVDFKAGDCLLIPAAYEGVTKFVEDTEYLTITI